MNLTYSERGVSDLWNLGYAADEREQLPHTILHICRYWCGTNLNPIREQAMSCATRVSVLICDTINERTQFFIMAGAAFTGWGVSNFVTCGSVNFIDIFNSVALCSSIDSRHCT